MFKSNFFRNAFLTSNEIESSIEQFHFAESEDYADFVQGIIRVMVRKTYYRGDFICHKHDRGEEMYLIVSGRLVLIRGQVGIFIEDDLSGIIKKTEEIYGIIEQLNIRPVTKQHAPNSSSSIGSPKNSKIISEAFGSVLKTGGKTPMLSKSPVFGEKALQTGNDHFFKKVVTIGNMEELENNRSFEDEALNNLQAKAFATMEEAL